MVRAAALASLTLILASTGLALTFDVDVGEVADHSFKDFHSEEETETVHEAGGVVENIGSVACTYTLRAEYRYSDSHEESFSRPVDLWQGASAEMTVKYIPKNHTGRVEGELFLEYCGNQERIDEFSFNVTENTLPGAEIDSRTVESSYNSALIEIEGGDHLIPEEAPGLWKSGHGDIKEYGLAELRYEPTVFSETHELEYTVVENGSVAGTTTVSLEPEPSLAERIEDNIREILLAALILSVLVNIGYLAERRGLDEKIKSLKQ